MQFLYNLIFYVTVDNVIICGKICNMRISANMRHMLRSHDRYKLVYDVLIFLSFKLKLPNRLTI